MTDFTAYKEKKAQEVQQRRNQLLEELDAINHNLLKSDFSEKDEKISYKLEERRQLQELEKMADITKKLNQEAREIQSSWAAEGFDPLAEDE